MKTICEVLAVTPSTGLTIKIASFDNRKDAKEEADRLYNKDQQPYDVIEVIRHCIYKIG